MPPLATATDRRTFRSEPVDLFRLLESQDVRQRFDAAADQPVVITIPILPAGQFEHPMYGKLDWNQGKFLAMKANFDGMSMGIVPMLNFDHSACNPYAAEARAAGWFKSIIPTPTGLQAEVELTPCGVEAIQRREYRYISGEVAERYTTSTGQMFEHVIMGAALTNHPFHDQMTGLFNQPLPLAGAADPEQVKAFAEELGTVQLSAFGEINFGQIREAVYAALIAEARAPYPAVDGDVWLPYQLRPYIREIFPSFVIYELGDGPPFFKRSYTVTDGGASLADDKVEVEQVWIEVARASFAAAIKDFRRDLASVRAGDGPAGGPSGMTTPATAPRKTWGQMFRQFLGLAEDAPADQVTQAFDKPVGEIPIPAPVTPPAPQQFQVPAGQVLLSATEVEQLRLKAGETDTARQELARTKAEGMVDGYIAAGKVLPAQREASLAFALADPVQFKALFDAAQPQVDLTKKGLAVGGQGGEPRGTAETFLGYVGQLQTEKPGLSYGDAVELAARTKPELYEAHRIANRR